VRRIPARQWAYLVVVSTAVVVGTMAALVIIRSPSYPPVSATGPPLANPSLLQSATASSGAAAIPMAVRIIVPAGLIDIPVIEGDGLHIPLFKAMHYPGTAAPGAGSTSLFYAHARTGMFVGLWKLHTGDEIRVVRADGSVLRYTVHEIRQVPWNDVDILRPTQFEQIVLLTCTTYSPYDPRFVVFGTPA
jgi:LPXTG-site transpeptidase (sortase) family protein